jgi:hypothetical protein
VTDAGALLARVQTPDYAVSGVALQHRAAETWLDLPFELWQVLTETAKTRFGMSD